MALFGRKSIGRLQAEGDVVGLIDALIRASEGTFRVEQFREAANALVDLGDAGVEALVQQLRADGRIRRHVAGCLDEAFHRARGARAARAAELLTSALQDRDEEVRQATAVILQRLRDPVSTEALARALVDPATSVRESAALGLAEHGDLRAIGPLNHYAVQGPHPFPGTAAVLALGRLGDARAVPALVAAKQAASAHRMPGLEQAIQDALDRIAFHNNTSADALLLGRQSMASREPPDAWLARWAAAPAGECDLCSRPITPETSRRVPNQEFRDVVTAGYDPYARRRMSAAVTALAMAEGLEDSYLTWIGTVMTDETDWGLCLDCATDVAAFLSEGGNGFTTSS